MTQGATEAVRITRTTLTLRLLPTPKAAYQLAAALALALGYAVIITAFAGALYFGRSSTEPTGGAKASGSWSERLRGVEPYSVQRGYGASAGLTCDLAVYTTNAAALDGRTRLRPGDTTATVCVVRKAQQR